MEDCAYSTEYTSKPVPLATALSLPDIFTDMLTYSNHSTGAGDKAAPATVNSFDIWLKNNFD